VNADIDIFLDVECYDFAKTVSIDAWNGIGDSVAPRNTEFWAIGRTIGFCVGDNGGFVLESAKMSVRDFPCPIMGCSHLCIETKEDEDQQNEAKNHRLERYQKQTVLNKVMLQHRLD
jgi:hypothetical protein